MSSIGVGPPHTGLLTPLLGESVREPGRAALSFAKASALTFSSSSSLALTSSSVSFLIFVKIIVPGTSDHLGGIQPGCHNGLPRLVLLTLQGGFRIVPERLGGFPCSSLLPCLKLLESLFKSLPFAGFISSLGKSCPLLLGHFLRFLDPRLGLGLRFFSVFGLGLGFLCLLCFVVLRFLLLDELPGLGVSALSFPFLPLSGPLDAFVLAFLRLDSSGFIGF